MGIGMDAMDEILAVSHELQERVRESFAPFEGIYRLNDWAEYISRADWDEIWSKYPDWWADAWMLAGNGRYSAEDVAAMSIDEIRAVSNSAGFCPEYAYYTEADETGRP